MGSWKYLFIAVRSFCKPNPTFNLLFYRNSVIASKFMLDRAVGHMTIHHSLSNIYQQKWVMPHCKEPRISRMSSRMSQENQVPNAEASRTQAVKDAQLYPPTHLSGLDQSLLGSALARTNFHIEGFNLFRLFLRGSAGLGECSLRSSPLEDGLFHLHQNSSTPLHACVGTRAL